MNQGRSGHLLQGSLKLGGLTESGGPGEYP